MALALVIAATVQAAAAQATVTAAAVWRPDAGFMPRFHKRCDENRGAAFADCFAGAMQAAGAPQAALDFTRRLGNEGYLEALDPTAGPIAVAHVLYPFRANENAAWLLVNGTPALIDIDDQRYLALSEMRLSPAYAAIRRRYPKVAFWPGARGAAGPDATPDGLRFVVGYLLRDFCHACQVVGRVRFAFAFDRAGKFLGSRLVSVVAAGNKPRATTMPGAGGRSGCRHRIGRRRRGDSLDRDAESPSDAQEWVIASGSITSAHTSVGAAATWPTSGTALTAPEVIRHGAAATPQPLNPTAISSSQKILMVWTTALSGLGSGRAPQMGTAPTPRVSGAGLAAAGESDRAYRTPSPRAAMTRDNAVRQSGCSIPKTRSIRRQSSTELSGRAAGVG